MPEPISQATPQEPVTPEGPIVPESTAQAASAQPEQQTEKPLTPEDYRKIAREEALKIAQSQVAKGENRIQKLIKEKFDALDQTKGALNLSDDQVAQARQKIVADAYSAPEEQPTQTTPPEQQAQPAADEAITYLNTQIATVFEQAGVAVTRSDPEFQSLQDAVNQGWNDPKGFAKIMIAANTAATTKKARLQSQQSTAAARVVGSGPQSSGQVPVAKTNRELWENAHKK